MYYLDRRWGRCAVFTEWEKFGNADVDAKMQGEMKKG
jgi:hypothetical protein